MFKSDQNVHRATSDSALSSVGNLPVLLQCYCKLQPTAYWQLCMVVLGLVVFGHYPRFSKLSLHPSTFGVLRILHSGAFLFCLADLRPFLHPDCTLPKLDEVEGARSFLESVAAAQWQTSLLEIWGAPAWRFAFKTLNRLDFILVPFGPRDFWCSEYGKSEVPHTTVRMEEVCMLHACMVRSLLCHFISTTPPSLLVRR